jgi:Septum formation
VRGRRTGRRWSAALALAVVGLGLTACSREAVGNDLEVGDCVVDRDTLESSDISTVDCGEDHVFELYAKVDLDEDADYPGDQQIEAQAQEVCGGDSFEEYVGVPFVDSEIFMFPVWPTEETWEQADDRTILCFAVTEELSTTTGSVEGANR